LGKSQEFAFEFVIVSVKGQRCQLHILRASTKYLLIKNSWAGEYGSKLLSTCLASAKLLSSNSKTTKKCLNKNVQMGGALVAHICNQEDQDSKPAWANSLQDPISKKSFTKKGC
jgi:hypothetical protein